MTVRIVATLPALCLLGAFVLLAGIAAAVDPATYTRLTQSFHSQLWDYPFVDTQVILSWLECHRNGIDVIDQNPCDSLGRTLAYPPAWLALAGTGLGTEATVAVGLLWALIFIGAVFKLPVAPGWGAAAITTAMYLSPPVFFGLERANADLIVFALAIVAARASVAGPSGRLVGYAASLLAALMKIYPVVLLVFVARERFPRIVAISLALVALLGSYLALAGPDLLRIVRGAGIPSAGWFDTLFGAGSLPHGLAELAPRRIPSWRLAYAVITAGAVGMAAAVLWWGGLRRRLAALDPFEAALLQAGSVMIVACFFMGQSVMYRGILLLLALPALLRMAQAGSLLMAATVLAVGTATWSYAYQLPASPQNFTALHFGVWLGQQGAWWWLVVVLAAIVAVQIADSPAARQILGILRRRTAPAA